jgi:hypothetical protein
MPSAVATSGGIEMKIREPNDILGISQIHGIKNALKRDGDSTKKGADRMLSIEIDGNSLI